jgi:hypothetical protein
MNITLKLTILLMERLNWLTDRVTMLFQLQSLCKAKDIWKGTLYCEFERISNKEVSAA